LQDRQISRQLVVSKADDGHDDESTDQGEEPKAPTNPDIPSQGATKETGKANTDGINEP
jgi:hypothetical protein